jgi:hypothetical protein
MPPTGLLVGRAKKGLIKRCAARPLAVVSQIVTTVVLTRENPALLQPCNSQSAALLPLLSPADRDRPRIDLA